MHEGEKDGVSLLLWMKIKYETKAKIDLIMQFYSDKLRCLKLRVNGSLHDYIDRFQGLSIVWREIDPTVQAEEKLVTQLVDQIEDPLFTGPCESIRNWIASKKTFRDAATTLRGHEISKNTGQTKKAIKNEVNNLLMGNVYVKRRATGKAKAIWGFKLGGQEANYLQERVPLKVWRMLYPEAQDLIKAGGEGKIGIVKEGGVKAKRGGGGKLSKTNKSLRTKLLRLCMEDGKQNPNAIKDLDELLRSVGEP